MPTFIESPTTVPAVGSTPKLIDEYVGRVNSKTDEISVAHMRSPKGWKEPGQSPCIETSNDERPESLATAPRNR